MQTRSVLSAAESLQHWVYPPYQIRLFLFLPRLGNYIALYCTTKQTHSSYKATPEKCILFLIVARTRAKFILAKTRRTLQETSVQNFWVSAIAYKDRRTSPIFVCMYCSEVSSDWFYSQHQLELQVGFGSRILLFWTSYHR